MIVNAYEKVSERISMKNVTVRDLRDPLMKSNLRDLRDPLGTAPRDPRDLKDLKFQKSKRDPRDLRDPKWHQNSC